MKTNHPRLSIVIPAFNEEENLAWHHGKLSAFLADLKETYEIIYIDDGSADKSLHIIKELARKDKAVHYISFSRNFGKEAALSAGYSKAKGDAIIAMDADGQHPVELIKTFLREWELGNDIIIGVRQSNQGEGFVKSTAPKLFYKLLRLLDSNKEVVSASTDFRLIDRRVIDEFNKLTERNRVTRNLIDWLGFKRVLVPFHAEARHAGNAGYSVHKLVALAMSGLIKHSTKPLQFIGGLGMVISVVSVVLAVLFAFENYVLQDPLKLAVTGTAILALFLSFLIGIVLVCQGLLALYVENVYYETQNRPLYIVREEE